jgi:hypothetical protein
VCVQAKSSLPTTTTLKTSTTKTGNGVSNNYSPQMMALWHALTADFRLRRPRRHSRAW